MTDCQALDTQQALLLHLPEKQFQSRHRQVGREEPGSPCGPRAPPPPPLPRSRGGGQLGSGEGVPSPIAALQALEGIHQPQLRVRERPQLLKGPRIQFLLLFFPLRRPQGKHCR